MRLLTNGACTLPQLLSQFQQDTIVGENRQTHNLSARAEYAETGMWEITPEKSASVYERVRSNRYDLFGMSLDENRV